MMLHLYTLLKNKKTEGLENFHIFLRQSGKNKHIPTVLNRIFLSGVISQQIRPTPFLFYYC